MISRVISYSLWQHFKPSMPVLRNVYPSHQSGRLGKQTPVIYDGDGWPAWPTPESINYRPNIEPLNVYMNQASFLSSLGLLPMVPHSDHQYSHSGQQEHRPLIPFDGRHYSSPSITNASCPPSPHEGYTRRRKPPIPRPRNAFIIFRSTYITGRTAAGEGPQYELSKQAGEVWKRMTDEEKEPFTLLSDVELKNHQAKYPNYAYRPERSSVKRKGSARTIKARATKKPISSSTPLVSPKSTTPEIASVTPTLRPLHADAQLAVQPRSIPPSPTPVSPPRGDCPMQENLEVVYPKPNPSANMDVVVPSVGTRASESTAPIEVDDFVPTADIPELQLTPSNKEEPEHGFDLSMRPSNLDLILEQFGFKYHDFTTILSHLPPIPDLNDIASTEDAPSFFSRTLPPVTSVPDDSFECSMTTEFWQSPIAPSKAPQQPFPDFSWAYSLTPSPANFPTTPMSCNTPLFSSIDGNISDCLQQSANGLAAPQQPAPDFIWSSDNMNDHDDPMSSQDMMVEDDFSFMSHLFDLNPLNDPFFGYTMY